VAVDSCVDALLLETRVSRCPPLRPTLRGGRLAAELFVPFFVLFSSEGISETVRVRSTQEIKSLTSRGILRMRWALMREVFNSVRDSFLDFRPGAAATSCHGFAVTSEG
jgi:hypothetical protein